MSRMIPSQLSPEIKSNAERKIFAWFRDAPGTDDWVVLHSLGIANHRDIMYGEVDFVVLVPDCGLFALEVKGGRVSRINGNWQFTDKYGTVSVKSRSPFDQASAGIFSVMDTVRKKYGADSKIGRLLFGSGVMFPDIIFDLDEIDTQQWQVFDQRDKENVKGYIHRLSVAIQRQWEEKYGTPSKDKIPDKKDIKELIRFLRGDFDKAVSLAAQIDMAEHELIRLTEEQFQCLDQLEDNPRCLIEGTAGTGKTLIAVESVKRAVSAGEKVALFCFNTMLGEWFKEHFKNTDVSLCPRYAGTFHDFIFQIAGEAGMAITKPENAPQSFYRVDMPLWALEAVEKLNRNFDRIILDEAQDLINENYLEVFDALLKGGINRGTWHLFGDFTQQAIYTDLSGDAMKALLDTRTGFVRYRLTINCRNTKPIGEVIKRLTGFDKQNYFLLKTEGPPVVYYQWKSMEEQRDILTDILDRLLEKDSIEPGTITVLSPHRREHSVVSTITIPVANYTLRSRQVTFHTIQGFKGLENTVIILTDIDSYEQEQLLYIGLSRARSSLIILESKKACKERVKKQHETAL